jgi:hypothetical protein
MEPITKTRRKERSFLDAPTRLAGEVQRAQTPAGRRAGCRRQARWQMPGGGLVCLGREGRVLQIYGPEARATRNWPERTHHTTQFKPTQTLDPLSKGHLVRPPHVNPTDAAPNSRDQGLEREGGRCRPLRFRALGPADQFCASLRETRDLYPRRRRLDGNENEPLSQPPQADYRDVACESEVLRMVLLSVPYLRGTTPSPPAPLPQGGEGGVSLNACTRPVQGKRGRALAWAGRACRPRMRSG